MNNLLKLQSKVNEIIKEANKKPVNVGALRGVMVGRDSVMVNGNIYTAIAGTQANTIIGACVWVQLASNSTAVIIGA
ncbi:hypothetical protein [Anaerovibrio sp. JC8]|uniref:hypothetical protein n=1 Tax=Anaerovibrio sp. JC8 TaxID=1240085 RepID=UPI000A10BC38|nr:hypothetical protein [Anaerovibrio sp. JC8]